MNRSVKLICKAAEKLKNNYHEKDPFRICKELGIKLFFYPMGSTPLSCKGFFLNQNRIKSITINSNLSPEFQKIICAHELGHYLLHKSKHGLTAFHDFALFDALSEFEYEANMFAAEFLIDDDEIMDKFQEDLSFFQIASELYVPPEILCYKFGIMKNKGLEISDAPIYTSKTWLKDAKDDGICEI